MTAVDLSDIRIADIAGDPVRLGDIVDRPTIINVVRYYGCAPCRQLLFELNAGFGPIRSRGGDVIGVGPRAAYQARLLMERRHIQFRLLLDPEHRVASAVGLGRQSLFRWIFDLRAWGRWLKGFLRAGQGMVTAGWGEVPAIILIDADCRVRWSYLGRSMGDYPPMEKTLDELARVMESGSP